MLDSSQGQSDEHFLVPLDILPPSAVQALYHSVTGRAENYSDTFRGNVLIKSSDIDNLYEIVKQQIAVYRIFAGPTVNVIMTHHNDKKVRYSSWERWKGLPVNVKTVTSDLTIRWEFVFQLPATDTKQRCVINITLDSGLPLTIHDDPGTAAGFIMVFGFSPNYKTVRLSIDFVDFLVAKTFAGFIEEWFSHLDKIQPPRWAIFITKNFQIFNSIFDQFTRLGLSAFLLTFALLHKQVEVKLLDCIYAISVCIFVWSIISIFSKKISTNFTDKVLRCIPPSVILLTTGDEDAFNRFKSTKNSYYIGIISFSAMSFFSIALNVRASFIYSYLTQK